MSKDAVRLIQQAMAHKIIAYDEIFPVTMETVLFVKGWGGIRLIGGGS